MFPQTPDRFVGQQNPGYDGRTTGEYQRAEGTTNTSIPTNQHQSQQSGPYSLVCAKCWHHQEHYLRYPNPPPLNTTPLGPYPSHPQQTTLPVSEYNVYRSFHASPAPHNSSIPKQSITYQNQASILSNANHEIPPRPTAGIKQEPQSPTNENNTPPLRTRPQQQPQSNHPQSTISPTQAQPGDPLLSRPIYTLPPPLNAKAVARPDPSQVMVTMSQSAYMNIISRLTKLEERDAAEMSQKSLWWGQNAQILAYEHHNLKERFSSLEEEMSEVMERLDDTDERLEDLETADVVKDRGRWSTGNTTRPDSRGRYQRPDSGYATTPEYNPTSWTAPRDGDAIMREAEVVIKREPGTSTVDRLGFSYGRKRALSDPEDADVGYTKKRRDS